MISRTRQLNSKGWARALDATLYQASRLISSIEKRLAECQVSLRIPNPIATNSVRDIVADLKSLSQEFAEVNLNLRARTLTVTTDDIVLEDVHLGEFRIELSLNELHSSQAYCVIAVDPQPAASNEEVTHPHVMSEKLCEGEGKIAIRDALRQGRLFDFFVLVRQILQTYNPGSAYYKLSGWEGRRCEDCGCRTCDDDSTSCDRCSNHSCFDCLSSCSDCDRYCCNSCCSCCSECSGTVCSSCIERCTSCNSPFCSRCLTDLICSHCEDPQETPSDECEDTPETTAIEDEASGATEQRPTAEVHTVVLGETPALT